MVLNSTMLNRWLIRDSRSPIWKLIKIVRRLRFLCYLFEMMFSFCFQGVTGADTGWFRVSFDTRYGLCIVSRYRLILDMFYVTFQGCHLRDFMVIVYKSPVSLTSVFKVLLFSELRQSRLRQTEISICLVEQLLLQFASRMH